MAITPLIAAQPCAAALAQQGPTLIEFIRNVFAILSVPLGMLTFWLGYRQRVYERNRSYYQDAVIDVLLPDVIAVFDELSLRLSAAGQEAVKGLSSSRKTLPRSCSLALANFADILFKLQDRVIQRSTIFDESLLEPIRDVCQATQDEITAWFEDAGLHKKREIPELDLSLRKNERLLIRLLYQGEAQFLK